jgi:hypothetical protein
VAGKDDKPRTWITHPEHGDSVILKIYNGPGYNAGHLKYIPQIGKIHVAVFTSKLIEEHVHSSFPVTAENIDDIIAFLNYYSPILKERAQKKT